MISVLIFLSNECILRIIKIVIKAENLQQSRAIVLLEQTQCGAEAEPLGLVRAWTGEREPMPLGPSPGRVRGGWLWYRDLFSLATVSFQRCLCLRGREASCTGPGGWEGHAVLQAGRVVTSSAVFLGCMSDRLPFLGPTLME